MKNRNKLYKVSLDYFFSCTTWFSYKYSKPSLGPACVSASPHYAELAHGHSQDFSRGRHKFGKKYECRAMRGGGMSSKSVHLEPIGRYN